MFPKVVLEFVLAAVVSAGTGVLSADPAPAPQTDGEVWNEGVEYFRNNDVTNALRVLRPLMLSKTHGARAAEVVAKLEYDRGNLEEAAGAAQIALRAAPDDAKANRNFTRATDGLPQLRETKRINAVLQAAQGKESQGTDPLSAWTVDGKKIPPNVLDRGVAGRKSISVKALKFSL